LAPGASTTVTFRVTVDANATGTIANQAVVTAAGMSGAPSAMFPSDGNGADPGTPPTTTIVDGCLMDSDCSAPTPACRNTGAHPWICVECKMNSHCAMDVKPICDTTTNMCRACAADAECPAATPACHQSGRCTQCSMTRPTCPGTARCNVGTGTCDGCLTNADCAGTTPICDTTSRMCRACRMDNECPAAAPLCLMAGAPAALVGSCGECTETNKTRCVAPRPACDVGTAKCVECTTNAECPMARPVCDATMKVCRTCTADAECPAASPFCAAGVCAVCRTHADCSGLTPLCTAGVCGPCRTDAECTAKDPRFPACHVTGLLTGACTECSTSNRTLCRNPGPKPECLLNLGFCGCSATDGDSECGDLMSGIVCNAPVGICVPGCSTMPGRNGCPAMQTCNVPAGQPIGACVVGECTTDADCRSPLPKCDTATVPRQCRGCLVDLDCLSPFVCDSAASKTCVECTPQKTTNCSSNGAGTRCLPNSTCGCGADNECGGPTSGRVCDLGLSKCSPGCRGTGGNGCPVGFRCSSTDNSIGQCFPNGVPFPDAGPDVAPDTAPPVDAPLDAPADTVVADGGLDAAAPVDVARDVSPDRTAPPLVDAAWLPDFPPAPDRPPAPPGPGIPGYLGGGGCNCEVGGDTRSSGSAGLALVVPVALVAFAVRRRRRGRGGPRPRP
jgi:MYXO-CTERM domain-containing protein